MITKTFDAMLEIRVGLEMTPKAMKENSIVLGTIWRATYHYSARASMVPVCNKPYIAKHRR